MSERTKFACVVTLVGLSLLLAVYQGLTYWYDLEASEQVGKLAGFVYLLVLVTWVDEDSRTQPAIYRPFEYGLFALIFWIPYLPYYFWRTRKAKGLLMFAGLLALFYVGWFIQWLIYFFAR